MALEKVSEESDALVASVTVPAPKLRPAKVAVSFTLSAPSRPGVPPLASQFTKFVQLPLPAVQVD